MDQAKPNVPDPPACERWWWKTLCPGVDTHTQTISISQTISLFFLNLVDALICSPKWRGTVQIGCSSLGTMADGLKSDKLCCLERMRPMYGGGPRFGGSLKTKIQLCKWQAKVTQVCQRSSQIDVGSLQSRIVAMNTMRSVCPPWLIHQEWLYPEEDIPSKRLLLLFSSTSVILFIYLWIISKQVSMSIHKGFHLSHLLELAQKLLTKELLILEHVLWNNRQFAQT